MTRLLIVAGLALALASCDGSSSTKTADADLAGAAAAIRAQGYNCRAGLGMSRTAEHADGSKTYKFTCAGGVEYRIDIQKDGSQRLLPWPEG